MNKVVSTLAVLGMIAGLCTGCGKTDKPEPETVVQPKESNAKKWTPEVAEPPKTHNVNDGGDHSGHNH